MATKLIMPAPQQVAYIEIPVGQPGPGEVLARTVISGISHGTEMTAFMGTSPFIERTITPERFFRDKTTDDPGFYPFNYAGYDAVGVVEAVGEGVTHYQPGDRVWREVQHQTAFLFREDESFAFRLEPQVPNEEAIMLNLSSVALGAVLDAEIKLGDAVAVFGGGIVGQLAAQMAMLSGARTVLLVEPLTSRRAMAERTPGITAIDPATEHPAQAIRARNDGCQPDVVIECSGSMHGLRGALATAGVGGTVVAAGFYAGNATALNLGEEFIHNRITIKASMTKWGCPSRFPLWDTPRVLRESLHLLEARKLRLDGFLTATVPFPEAQRAYEMIRDEPATYLKVALTY